MSENSHADILKSIQKRLEDIEKRLSIKESSPIEEKVSSDENLVDAIYQHKEKVKCIKISPNKKIMATSSKEEIKLYDLEQKLYIGTIDADEYVIDMKMSNNKLIYATLKSLVIIDISRDSSFFKNILKIQNHGLLNGILTLHLTPDNTKVIISDSQDIKSFNIRSDDYEFGSCLKTFRYERCVFDKIRDVKITNDKLIVILYNVIEIWDIKTGRLLKKITTPYICIKIIELINHDNSAVIQFTHSIKVLNVNINNENLGELYKLYDFNSLIVDLYLTSSREICVALNNNNNNVVTELYIITDISVNNDTKKVNFGMKALISFFGMPFEYEWLKFFKPISDKLVVVVSNSHAFIKVCDCYSMSPAIKELKTIKLKTSVSECVINDNKQIIVGYSNGDLSIYDI